MRRIFSSKKFGETKASEDFIKSLSIITKRARKIMSMQLLSFCTNKLEVTKNSRRSKTTKKKASDLYIFYTIASISLINEI